MSKQIYKRFNKNSIIAGILHLVNNPDKYKKYRDYITKEYIFYNDTSSECESMRMIVDVLHKITKNDDYTFVNQDGLMSQIQIKVIDEKKADLLQAYYSEWLDNPEIQKLINSPDNFEVFLSYLKVIQFSKNIVKFSEHYNLGEVEECSNVMQEAIDKIKQINGSNSVRELDMKSMSDIVYKRDARSVIPPLTLASGGSGKNPFDDIVGGFEAQTLNLILGETGGGKSMLGHHIIERCIEQRRHVMVIALEDREKSFAFKYVANMTNIPIRRLRKNVESLTSEENSRIKTALEAFDKYVTVRFINGLDINAIHKICMDYDDECVRLGKPVPSVNMVDYTGHIAGSFGNKNDKSYERYRAAYAARKDYALSSGKICFDFAQVNREGAKGTGQNHLLSHYDLAGAFDLAQVCDTIFSINRDAVDRTNSTARLYIAKSRDSENAICVKVSTDFQCASFNMEEWEWGSRDISEDIRKNFGDGTFTKEARLV